MPGNPKPLARWYSGTRLCRSSGSEMAHGRVEHRGKDERLVHVALAGGAVAEVDDGRLAVLAHQPVALDPHRVTGGVQRLGADHDRVHVEVVLRRVPATVADAAEQLKELHRIQPAAPGHPVLAVGGEGHVARAERPPGADLRRLLAEQRRPDTQFALALQRDRLGVDAADYDEVAVQSLHLVGGQFQGIVGVLDPLPLGREQLDGIHARPGLPVQAGGSRCGGDRTVSIDGHVPLLVIGAGCGITVTGQWGP
jgi:hypothetical protein